MKYKSTWKYRPVNVKVVFRAYANVIGLLGIVLLLWGPNDVRIIAVISVAAACCAAALSSIGDTQEQTRNLFWFAMGHVALWLTAFWTLKGAAAQGPLDPVVAVVGGVAFVLFCLWLIIEGEFSETPHGKVGFFGPPSTLQSQYEQKIRQAAAQEERNRLARDLHDSIKQQIFAIQTAAATAQVRIQGDSNGARDALDQIRSAAREAMTEMEVMLDQLRAEPLESTGLVAALKKLCESVGFRTGAQVEFKLGAVPSEGLAAPAAAEATLRVAQEALANVARHARASHVLVSLDSRGGQMELAVQDDGAGFDPAQDSRGMGMANMRARAEELGGRLDLASGRDTGTTVKFSIPAASISTADNRRKYRNRAIALGLMVVTIFLNDYLHHWSLAPALAFVMGLSVFHYFKARTA